MAIINNTKILRSNTFSSSKKLKFPIILFQVKIWFQNRRNKWKRQLAADMEAANLAGRYTFYTSTIN